MLQVQEYVKLCVTGGYNRMTRVRVKYTLSKYNYKIFIKFCIQNTNIFLSYTNKKCVLFNIKFVIICFTFINQLFKF